MYRHLRTKHPNLTKEPWPRIGSGASISTCLFFSELKPDDPILELGCGPGTMMRFLKKNGFSNVAGIDISEEQVKRPAEQGLNAQVADVFQYLRQAEGAFRAVIAIDFIEHFTKDELVRLIPLISSSLTSGGQLIVQTSNGEGLFPQQVIYGDLTHLTIFTPASLQQLLRLSGFTKFRFLETGPVPGKISGRARTVLWGAIKAIANSIRRIETGKTQNIWTENLICYCEKP